MSESIKSLKALTPAEAKEIATVPDVITYVNVHIMAYAGMAKKPEIALSFFPKNIYNDKKTKELLENTFINAGWKVAWKAYNQNGQDGYLFVTSVKEIKEESQEDNDMIERLLVDEIELPSFPFSEETFGELLEENYGMSLKEFFSMTKLFSETSELIQDLKSFTEKVQGIVNTPTFKTEALAYLNQLQSKDGLTLVFKAKLSDQGIKVDFKDEIREGNVISHPLDAGIECLLAKLEEVLNPENTCEISCGDYGQSPPAFTVTSDCVSNSG